METFVSLVPEDLEQVVATSIGVEQNALVDRGFTQASKLTEACATGQFLTNLDLLHCERRRKSTKQPPICRSLFRIVIKVVLDLGCHHTPPQCSEFQSAEFVMTRFEVGKVLKYWEAGRSFQRREFLLLGNLLLFFGTDFCAADSHQLDNPLVLSAVTVCKLLDVAGILRCEEQFSDRIFVASLHSFREAKPADEPHNPTEHRHVVSSTSDD